MAYEDYFDPIEYRPVQQPRPEIDADLAASIEHTARTTPYIVYDQLIRAKRELQGRFTHLNHAGKMSLEEFIARNREVDARVRAVRTVDLPAQVALTDELLEELRVLRESP